MNFQTFYENRDHPIMQYLSRLYKRHAELRELFFSDRPKTDSDYREINKVRTTIHRIQSLGQRRKIQLP